MESRCDWQKCLICTIVIRGVQLVRACLSIVYLSLGSNVGNREQHLRDAIACLEAEGRVTAISSFYDTEPVDFTAQSWFLNCALALETEKTPENFMQAALRIEWQMGRQRAHDKGPRIIDIDILLYDGLVLSSDGLTIPHPAMHQRRFVLEPLVEIAPDVRHPLLMRSVAELRDTLPQGQAVRKFTAG